MFKLKLIKGSWFGKNNGGIKLPDSAKHMELTGKDLDLAKVKEHKVKVGRSSDCTIVIDGKKVSRRHCGFKKKGLHWYLADLESSYGTGIKRGSVILRLFPGGLMQTTFFKLEKGDEIILGIDEHGEPMNDGAILKVA